MKTYLQTISQKQFPNTKELKKYKKTVKLTKIQREVFVGLLLGDGSMQTQNNGPTYRLIHVQGGRKKGVRFLALGFSRLPRFLHLDQVAETMKQVNLGVYQHLAMEIFVSMVSFSIKMATKKLPTE